MTFESPRDKINKVIVRPANSDLPGHPPIYGSFATLPVRAWFFRYLSLDHSLPGIFSHLFDLRRFATSSFFAVVRQLTIDYSLTTGIHQQLLIRSVMKEF